MADALWQSPAMRALRPQLEQERDNNCGLWQLPNWDEYSESGASVGTSASASEREWSRLDLSICSSDLDFGDESSSGAGGGDDGDGDDGRDVFARGKLRRSPVSIGGGDSASVCLPKRKSVLQQIHLRYAKQRQLEELASDGAKSTSKSTSGRDDSEVVECEAASASVSSGRNAATKGREPIAVAAEATAAPIAVDGERASTSSPLQASGAKAIAAQQSLLNSQLQSFRLQLLEMQKQMAPATAGTMESSFIQAHPVKPLDQQKHRTASTRQSRRDHYDMSMQTDGGSLHDDTVTQWLNLLTQKIDLLASECGHDATQNCRATIEHLAGLKIAATTGDAGIPSQEHNKSPSGSGSALDPKSPLQSSWHVGGALEMQPSQPTMEKLRGLEVSLARLSMALENSSQRNLELFEKSILQIENFHHEKLQQVVNESIDELKQVRGKYKAKQDQLEEELRVATRSADEWKQRAVEVEHKSALEQEKIEFKAATFREKFERLSVRFEEDIVCITQQLESARLEKAEAQASQAASAEAIEKLKQELSSMQEQYKALVNKRESENREFEQEQQHWNASLAQLRRENDQVAQEITKEKQALAFALEQVNQTHASEIITLENRFKMEVEDNYRATVVSEKIVELQRRHEKQLEAMRKTYEQQVEEQGRAVEKALEEVRESRQAASTETQTELSTLTLSTTLLSAGRSAAFVEDHQLEAEVRIQELSRKCKALESLLDKKFEQQSSSSQYGGDSMNPLCMSCSSSNSNRSHNNSPKSQLSLRSSGNFLPLGYEPASSKLTQTTKSNINNYSRVARKKEFASSASRSSLEDALFTDVDTTMRNETWDSASMTSADTFDPTSPYQVLSRPQSATRTRSRAEDGFSSDAGNGMPSNADILALVCKLEHYAANSNSTANEPEPEQSIYRTPESRVNNSRKAKPPPIQRGGQHNKKDAVGARKPHKPSTSMTLKPLRGSLLSSSSASSSSVGKNYRQSSANSSSTVATATYATNDGRSMPAAAAASKAQRSRFV